MFEVKIELRLADLGAILLPIKLLKETLEVKLLTQE